MFNVLIGVAAVAFALLAVWLALEPGSRVRRTVKRAGLAFGVGCLSVVLVPLTVAPTLAAYVHANGQGREGIAKRTSRKVSNRARVVRGYFRAFRAAGLEGLWSALRKPLVARLFAFPMAGADGSTDVLDDLGLSDSEKAEAKKVGDTVELLRGKLKERLEEMKGEDGADKEEVERREKELGEKVDTLIGFAKRSKSDELKQFESDLDERLKAFEKQMKEFGMLPTGDPAGVQRRAGQIKDRYEGDNLFLDMKESVRDNTKAEKIREYEEKFASADRLKAWAIEDLEDADLVLPDIQQALPFLRAKTKVVNLFREIRTSSPAVEFPVFKSGLAVGHVEPGQAKPESTPEFDLEVARVFTIAGISDVPNQTLEDFPAARGWIATELGAATGAQEEVDVLLGDGTGEPLGILSNTDVPQRKVDTTEGASAGRNIISSIFRGAQDVRTKGFTEPTDVALNPAVWTDIVLSFEGNIGFLYGPPQMGGGSGPVADEPPARIMGLPVTWSSFVPTAWGKESKKSPVIVGNFQDGIVLRRSPFRIDIDTSVGFKKNMTSFRGEERMGFIVVRPKSFVIISEIVPSA